MLRGIAEPRREHQRALQVKPGVVLVGEADRAVDLDRFARDAQAGFGAARLDPARDRGASIRRRSRIELAQSLIEHRRGELLLNVEIDRTVLQRLEAADRLPNCTRVFM